MSNPKEDAKLLEAINTIATKIKKFREQDINEATTKSAMIEPLLLALDWDTANPDRVRPEFKAHPNFNPVDYVLMAQGHIKLIIEAKRLGENLNAPKWFTEILANAAVTGEAEWGVLTDGDEYRIYKINVPVDANEKLFRTVRISSKDTDGTVKTLRLLSYSNMEDKRQIDVLWDEQFVDRRVKKALQTMLSPTDEKGHKGLISLIRSKFPGELTPTNIAESLSRLEVRFDSAPPDVRGRAEAATVEPQVVTEGSPTQHDGDTPRPAHGMDVFREALEGGKSITKADLMAKLLATEIAEGSARAYITWAKRPVTQETNAGKGGNPFRFQIVESTDERGNEILRKKVE